MGGGPGTGIYKSTDGGENWQELKKDYQKVIWVKLDLYYHHRMQMLFMQL